MSPAEPQRRPLPADEAPAGSEPLQRSTEPKARQVSDRHLRVVDRQARSRARRRHLVVAMGIGLFAVVSLALVGLHVLIAENQFTLNRLQQQAAAQQTRYQDLRLQVAKLEAPARIVSVAEGKLGMRLPGSVTYLPATNVATSPSGQATGAATPGTITSSGSATSQGSGASSKAGGGDIRPAPQGNADWPSVKPYLGIP